MDVLDDIEKELMRSVYSTDFEPGWKTIEGTHVLFGENGQVTHGPKGLKEWFSPHNDAKRKARLEQRAKQVAENPDKKHKRSGSIQEQLNQINSKNNQAAKTSKKPDAEKKTPVKQDTVRNPKMTESLEKANKWLKAAQKRGDKDAVRKFIKEIETLERRINIGKVLQDTLERNGVNHNPVKTRNDAPIEEDVIKELANHDTTGGSCSSLALSYIANRNGIKMLDFRGGYSRKVFANVDNATDIAEGLCSEGKAHTVKMPSDGVLRFLADYVEDGKEYYFATGAHAAVVRKQKGKFQYLELQNKRGGWKALTPRSLKSRFGCEPLKSYPTVLAEGEDLAASPDFKKLMGYINTDK